MTDLEVSVELKKHYEDKREKVNGFYITVNSFLISFITFFKDSGSNSFFEAFTYHVIPYISILININWIYVIKAIIANINEVHNVIIVIDNKGSGLFKNLIELNNKNSVSRKEIFMPILFLITFIIYLILDYRILLTDFLKINN